MAAEDVEKKAKLLFQEYINISKELDELYKPYDIQLLEASDSDKIRIDDETEEKCEKCYEKMNNIHVELLKYNYTIGGDRDKVILVFNPPQNEQVKIQNSVQRFARLDLALQRMQEGKWESG